MTETRLRWGLQIPVLDLRLGMAHRVWNLDVQFCAFKKGSPSERCYSSVRRVRLSLIALGEVATRRYDLRELRGPQR